MMNKSSCVIKSYHDEMSLFISHNTPYPDTNIAFFVCLFTICMVYPLSIFLNLSVSSYLKCVSYSSIQLVFLKNKSLPFN